MAPQEVALRLLLDRALRSTRFARQSMQRRGT